jgi:hypothetical protein
VLALWGVALAVAGDQYVVRWADDGLAYTWLATTATGDAALVTWPEQAVEVVVLADLSSSIGGDEARQMGHTIETLHEELLARPVEGDRLGVIAFGARQQRWVPLGSTARPGLDDWLDRFALPRLGPTSDALAFGDDDAALPVPPDLRAVDRRATEAAKAVHAAVEDLRAGDPHALKVVLVIWDGGHNGWYDLDAALDRAWAREIHVWSMSFTVPDGPLVTRGGGDAYIAPAGTGPEVVKRIVSELRF